MKHVLRPLVVLLALVASGTVLFAQSATLPKGMTPDEAQALPSYIIPTTESSIPTPPAGPLRPMAEWEEIEYLVVTWTGYTATLREIVRYAVDETKVLIICTDSNQVRSNLTSASIPLTNVRFKQGSFNSVWLRDYGTNCVYQNDVDSLKLVEWIYNRPRPQDDQVPGLIADFTGLPLHATTTAPNDLVHTGGNFHTDGMNTAFSSELVLDENGPGNSFGVTAKTKPMIDSIMNRYLGVNRYATMPTLPYDGIHHIDMHWRFLDEETMLVGEYPTGMSDGPQIEANLQFILANYPSAFGTPYRVVRIPMPPDASGLYPSQGSAWNPVDYRTYCNNVFVNKTLLLPIYQPAYDTTAIRILQEELPGYRVVGINCNQIIQASGALHCITREIGVQEPLRIVHQRLRDTYDTQNPYPVYATLQHKTGITAATLYWTTDTTQGFQPLAMSAVANSDSFFASIPAQAAGTQVYYYIEGNATSGKTAVRPLSAPAGFWTFRVLQVVSNTESDLKATGLGLPYPNPASAITCIPLHLNADEWVTVDVFAADGRMVKRVQHGILNAGDTNLFIHANELASGAYFIKMQAGTHISSAKLMVK